MKISRKLTLLTVGSLLTVGAAVLGIHYALMRSDEEDQLRTIASTVSPVIEESLSSSMISRDTRLLDLTLMKLVDIESLERIMLVNREGVVKAGTDTRMVGRRLSEGAGGTERRTGWVISTDSGERAYRWTQAVRNRPECYGCHDPRMKDNGSIVVELSSTAVQNNLRAHIAKESLLFASAFLVVGFLLFRFSNSLVIRRLGDLGETMKRFEGGDYRTRIPVTGGDEIARLAGGFNELATSVQGSQEALERYADELMSLAIASTVISAVPGTESVYEAVCTLAVKELKLTMAWLGLVRPGTFDIAPAAQCGFEDGYLSTVRVTWDDSPNGQGPTGKAVKTGTPQVTSDVKTSPGYGPWRAAALKRGYRSSMALPLLASHGEVLGVLNLYSAEPLHFDKKRMRIYTVFANQAASAIENRSLMEQREKTTAELASQFRIIQHSQEEWRLTFDSITDLISIHDREYRILKANKAFAEHFGLEPKDIIGRRCHDLFHGLCSPISGCPHETSVAERRAVAREIHDPRSNKIFLISTFPYFSPSGEFIGSVHIAKDVTEAREKESRLIMSERLASLGQMASGLAHEINNPLASIAGCAEGLLMKVRNGRYDPALFEEYLQIVEEEIQRCKSITTGMLSFVRKATYEKKAVPINESIDKTLEIIGFQGRLRDVEIVRNYAPESPVVYGSEGELRQVLLAIITNALDAMEDRGTLTMSTEVHRNRIHITIADTGPGIDPDSANRIFDPFYTTKSEKGGTGLGLSIAHKIIANHGGAIDAENAAGGGAAIAITLPLEEPVS